MQDRLQTEKRYRQLRLLVYIAVGNRQGVTLTGITAGALDEWGLRWDRSGELPDRGGWPWAGLVEHRRRNHPDRFELAIWHGGTLCGLALGKAAPSRAHLSVDYLEANPSPAHPLKGRIVRIALDAADHYGALTGCRRLRLAEPDPALIPRYEAMGFTLVRPARGKPYLERKIHDENRQENP